MFTARLVLTRQCDRRCALCCNHAVDWQRVPRVTVPQLVGFGQVCITGGEPMLQPRKLEAVVRALRAQNPSQEVYLYTARHSRHLEGLLAILDGVQYSLHAPLKRGDLAGLDAFQDAIAGRAESYRLFVDQAVEAPVTVFPGRWSRVRFGPMLEEAPLPAGEILVQLEDA